MKLTIKTIITSILIVLGAGCLTIQTSHKVYLHDSPVLILPPTMSATIIDKIDKKEITKLLYQEILSLTGGNAINAYNIKELELSIQKNTNSGRSYFNPKEIAALALVANTKSVIYWEILEYSPYAPQNIKIQIILLKYNPVTILKRKLINIDLNHKHTKKLFAEYLNENRFTTYSETFDPDQTFHAATLSPKLFQKFVINQTAINLLVTNIKEE